MCWALDALTIIRLRPCDVLICMSGIFVQAPRFARWRYGAKIILHRGSRHILSQKEILANLPKAEQVAAFTVRRELLGYELADKIAIPSSHVMESFSAWPKLAHKLFVSSYGVDLEQFPIRTGPWPSEPTVLFIGTWSFQKGADLVTQAVLGLDGVRLKHVGPVGDVPFPRHPRFVHYDPVPQWDLKRFYSAVHVCTLASRQDGFGMVLCQALASGLSIVCTDRTGGSDLARQDGLARLVRVVPAGDPEALRRALLAALDDETGRTDVAGITQANRELLSWRHYAIGHLDVMKAMLNNPGQPCSA
jgi:starch synthase